MRAVPFAITALTVGVATSAQAADEETKDTQPEDTALRVVVLPAEIDDSVGDKLPAGVFDEVVLSAVQQVRLDETKIAAIGKHRQLEVFGPSDLKAQLSFEKQRWDMGCGPECQSEVSAYMKAELLVSVNLAYLDEAWTMTTKLLRVAAGKTMVVESRQAASVSGDGQALLKAVPVIIEKLFDQISYPLPSRPVTCRPGRSPRRASSTRIWHPVSFSPVASCSQASVPVLASW